MYQSRLLVRIILCTCWLLCGWAAQAQPLTIVVPFSVGGAADIKLSIYGVDNLINELPFHGYPRYKVSNRNVHARVQFCKQKLKTPRKAGFQIELSA